MIHPYATIAIRAAKNFRAWGRQAALRYVERNGCPLRLYYLARTLAAVS